MVEILNALTTYTLETMTIIILSPKKPPVVFSTDLSVKWIHHPAAWPDEN